MKTIVRLSLALCACALLSACGGYPMTVESRTPPTAAQAQEHAQEQAITTHQRLSRARGAY